VHTLRTAAITISIRPPTSSLDVEVWIMTLTISRPWIMTMSCSQVCGCRRSLLLPCYALHRCRSVPCSSSDGLFRTMTQDCIHGSDSAALGVHSTQLTVAIATPKHSEEHPYGSPVPGTLDALLSQRYYYAGARGLSGLPIHRLTS